MSYFQASEASAFLKTSLFVFRCQPTIYSMLVNPILRGLLCGIQFWTSLFLRFLVITLLTGFDPSSR